MNTVVYEWRREDGTPYYVGIGKPQRPYKGRRNCGGPPPRDRIVILHEGLDWEKACEIERELIALHGRKDLGTGILRNLTDGGEGSFGYRHTEEAKAKMSEATSGENHPMYGKTGEKSHRYGKTHSEETRAKISKGNLGKKVSGETRAKMSKARLGENNHNYGKSLSKETKEKISEAMSGENHPMYGKRSHMYGKTHSEEAKAKISKANLGKKLSEETKAKLSESKLGENNPMYDKTGESNPNYKPRNWYHPVHGEVLQKSCADLVRMFPEQNLCDSALSSVALGKRPHHKGWKSC